MRYFLFDEQKYGFPLDMDLHRFELNPQLEFESDAHTIDFFEIMFFEAGKGKCLSNGYEIDIQPGTLLFASPHQVKRSMIEQTSARGFHLVFKSTFLESFFEDKLLIYRLNYFYNYTYAPYMVMAPEAYGFIAQCLRELLQEIQSFKSDSRQIIRALLYFVLSKLNRYFNAFHTISDDEQKRDILIQYKMLIETHIQSNKNCNDYADLLGVSRNLLNRKIKALTGVTAIDFLNQRKVQEVKSQLLFTDNSISEIAYALNFSDPNNLTRFFKTLTGQTPTSFRMMRQNDR